MGFSRKIQAFLVLLDVYIAAEKPPVHHSYPFVLVMYFSLFNADRVVIWFFGYLGNGLLD
jgi:hypothetical protein